MPHKDIEISFPTPLSLVITFRTRRVLDVENVESMRLELVETVRCYSGRAVIIDFDQVEYLSSAFLGLLVRLGRKVEAGHGTIWLCGMSENIRKLFQISGLDRIFKILQDQAAARRAAAVTTS